jgi:RHS repeat-associated protein
VHTDHLNAPRKIAQPTTGTLAWRWDTDPFGTVAPNNNPAGLGTFPYNLRFPGQYYMAETGLNYNWRRDYDPLTAKYAESDPIGLAAGVNTYSYVAGNPVSNVDPRGLCTVLLRFKPAIVDWISVYHGYVVTIDPNGTENYFRGGPSGSPTLNGAFGNIRAQYGLYLPGTRDWTTQDPPSLTVYHDDQSCACENSQFKSILDAINAKGIPYYPERQNSNSVDGTMLRDSGFPIGPLPVTAPAFGLNLYYGPE